MLPPILASLGQCIQTRIGDVQKEIQRVELRKKAGAVIQTHHMEAWKRSTVIIHALQTMDWLRQRCYKYFIDTICDLYVMTAKSKKPVSPSHETKWRLEVPFIRGRDVQSERSVTGGAQYDFADS